MNSSDLDHLTPDELRELCEKLLLEKNEMEERQSVMERQALKSKRRTIDVFGKMVDVRKAQRIIEWQNAELEEKNIEINRQKEDIERTYVKFRQRTIELFGKMIDLKKAYRIIEQQRDEIENQRKLLHETNISKDRFFSIVAHDLKNPIGGFLGLTEILASETHKLSVENQKIFIESLHESSKQLYTLLENLLQWARSQTGSLHLKPQVLEVENLVDSAIGQVSMNAQLKNISIRKNMANNLNVFADDDTMKTILRNLLSNAVKFSYPDGFIDVLVTQNNNTALISITDYGVGISATDLNKLFKIEHSVTGIGTAQEKGTGLGLILCKEFIELNHGKISVQSTLGKQSTFLIEMPVYKAEL